MVILIGIAGAALLVVCTAIMIRHIFIGSQMLKATIHPSDSNDDDRAIVRFTELLEQAHSKMTVYDDGNKMDGSIYMNEEVVDAVKKKLDNELGFTMHCYFNYDENDTLFRQTFDDHDRVDIRTRPNEDARPNDTHYKIIDDGRMAYLSRHDDGSSEREFQVIDCTRISKSALKGVTDRLLGEYKTDIAQKFPSV